MTETEVDRLLRGELVREILRSLEAELRKIEEASTRIDTP